MPDHDRMRVLVVEDEWMLAFAIAALVKRLGCDVVGPAGHVREAEALGREATVDAAILDINLHGEMTFPIARVLKERDLPFIFLTGYDSAVVPKEYAAAPVLQKPFSDEELTSVLQQLLDRRGSNAAVPHGRVGT